MMSLGAVGLAPPMAQLGPGGPNGTAPKPVPSNDALLPSPSTTLDAKAQMDMSLEAILMMSQAADTVVTRAKGLKAEKDSVSRKEDLDRMLAEMKEQAEKKNSPGFFSCVVKVVADFASDLVTNPAKIASDLGSNLKAAVNSPNFWADLKKICMKVVEVAALAAATVATVFSAGAASIAVAGVILAISALNVAQSEFHIAQRLGMSPKVAAGIQLGLAVVSIALSFGTNTAAVTGAVKAVKELATGVQVAGTAVGGVATIGDAHFQADALDRQARVKTLQSGMEALSDAIKALLDDIRDAKEDGSSVTTNIVRTIDRHNQISQSFNTIRA
ncbi:MAG: hypothetical protein JWP97_607 [Labilithrix sp.]|nr:hypothetical protein [Labilithrix sp.]